MAVTEGGATASASAMALVCAAPLADWSSKMALR
jgi:hypothetical protein